MEEKLCKTCKQTKPVSEFYRRKASKDGLSNRCKACESSAHRAYYKVKRIRLTHRKSKLKLNYGLSVKEFNRMFDEQDGACAICLAKGVPLVVDHNHATNEVRKLLCHGCNHGLGRFKDNPTIVRRAAEYLESYGNRNVTN